MKLLITGAGGQLGKEWVDFCNEQEIEFVAYSSKDLNIIDEDHLKEVFETEAPDVFINCAAYTKVENAEDESQLAGLINAEALSLITRLCLVHQTKLVHYSTDYVFSGSKEDQLKLPDGYPEDFNTDPINIYGATKRRGEEVVLSSKCDFLILRVSWLCGKHGNNFVKTMLKLGSERDELKVVNDQLGAPTFTNDVVTQTFELIKKNISGIFHLGSKGIISWFEFANEIFDQSGLSVKVKPVKSTEFPTKAKRPAFSKLSTQKISKIEGVEISDWKVGLKKLLADLE